MAATGATRTQQFQTIPNMAVDGGHNHTIRPYLSIESCHFRVSPLNLLMRLSAEYQSSSESSRTRYGRQKRIIIILLALVWIEVGFDGLTLHACNLHIDRSVLSFSHK